MLQSWGFHAYQLNSFLMTLFEKHTTLLKKRATEDFQEVCLHAGRRSVELEQLILLLDCCHRRLHAYADWHSGRVRQDHRFGLVRSRQGQGRYKVCQTRTGPTFITSNPVSFPCVLPFSQMYPMCCIDIRNFLSQAYSAPDDYLTRSTLIDETIKNVSFPSASDFLHTDLVQSLDELLCERICRPLIERLSSQYPGQIVQILTNLEHFERACQELQGELAQARSSRSRTGPIVLGATEEFKEAREKAKARIFKLVNSKIDDLVWTAEYNWYNIPGLFCCQWLLIIALRTLAQDFREPSNYMTELTRYLSSIMSSVLLGLPVEIKDMIYFDALRHAASNILVSYSNVIPCQNLPDLVLASGSIRNSHHSCFPPPPFNGRFTFVFIHINIVII